MRPYNCVRENPELTRRPRPVSTGLADGTLYRALFKMAVRGVDVARCLVILMLAPTVAVVGSEVRVGETPSL
jgi:hypothetical protein